MRPEEFQSAFNVSRETFEKLNIYYELLVKWQRSINLISRNSVDNIWERHFADSVQIGTYIPTGKKMLDMGSGAGFPGMILAIMRPDLNISLIESDERKCQFLRNVSRETFSDVEIINDRIENLKIKAQPEIVTARALAPLDILLGYCLEWAERNPALQMIFLKGENAHTEIDTARKNYDFNFQIRDSAVHSSGKVLLIKNLCFEEPGSVNK